MRVRTYRENIVLALFSIGAASMPLSLPAQTGTHPVHAEGLEVTVKIAWNAQPTHPVPVSADVPYGLPAGPGLHLHRSDDGTEVRVPCQRDPAVPGRIWWLASADSAGETVYALRAGAQDTVPGVVAERGEKSLGIAARGRSVLQYRHAPVPPPVGANPVYTRSAFIHPLWSPGGAVLTTIHPKDHVHHVGLWNPWTNTTFEGRHVDFWNLGKGQGTVRFVEFESVMNGPAFGGFRAIHEHVDLAAPGGEKVALKEVWDVRVWNWQAEDGSFLIDFTTTQICASDSALVLNAYRYGGFGFRARADWHDGDYLTSEGKTRKDGHGTRARWCHAYGPTPQGGAGVLFMSHPANRDHPEPMRLWPKGHLFFNYCPIQKKPWTLEPGTTYTLRYRLHVYDGQPSAADAEHLWQAYANPPSVSVTVSR